MEIVKIRSEAQSLNRPIDIRFDMRGRIGDHTILKARESTLRSDEDSIPDIVFSDEVSQKLLVHACLVDHGGIPEGTAELDGFEENWLCLFESEIASQAEAEAHGSEAWGWDLQVLELKRFDHDGSCLGES